MIIKKFYGETIQKAVQGARDQLGEDVVVLESVQAEGKRPASVTVMLDKNTSGRSRSAVPATPEGDEAKDEQNQGPVTYKRSDARKVKKAQWESHPSSDVDYPNEEEQQSSGAANRNGGPVRPQTEEKEQKKSSKRGNKQQFEDSEKQSQSESPSEPSGEAASRTGRRKSKKTSSKKDTQDSTEETQASSDPQSEKETSKSTAQKQPKSQQNQQITSPDELPEPKGLDDPPLDLPRDRSRSLVDESASYQQKTEQRHQSTAVNREINALHRRFDQVESMLSEALISANLDYAAHPAFQQLLQSGIRATTISGWFKEILNKGIDPHEQHDSFMFELARLVRDALTITLPKATEPNLVFVGPSGSGKTSLIMKLATNPEFFGDSSVALVSLQPRQFGNPYTILEPFAEDHKINFFRVKDGIDVTKLMPKLVDYDYVLFDTPSISLEKKTAFRDYWKIRQMLASVMPLEVHFVIDATLENYYFREAYATNHPLQPDYVAITHLDETARWGQLIPFLKTMGCSVRYMSQGSQVPDDIDAFSPTWFAEQILSS